ASDPRVAVRAPGPRGCRGRRDELGEGLTVGLQEAQDVGDYPPCPEVVRAPHVHGGERPGARPQVAAEELGVRGCGQVSQVDALRILEPADADPNARG